MHWISCSSSCFPATWKEQRSVILIGPLSGKAIRTRTELRRVSTTYSTPLFISLRIAMSTTNKIRMCMLTRALIERRNVEANGNRLCLHITPRAGKNHSNVHIAVQRRSSFRCGLVMIGNGHIHIKELKHSGLVLYAMDGNLWKHHNSETLHPEPRSLSFDPMGNGNRVRLQRRIPDERSDLRRYEKTVAAMTLDGALGTQHLLPRQERDFLMLLG